MKTPITLDQQLKVFGQQITSEQMGDNTLVPCRIGLEPLGGGIRVTARDEHGGKIWGFVASAPSLASGECLVAVYDGLRQLLERHGLGNPPSSLTPSETVANATRILDEIASTVEALKRSIDVRRASDATGRRAEAILASARDASRLLGSVNQR